ncbi:PKD domain-containing protein [Flavihumibacter sp. R14]|nr:PKD domain-containing protein [Flavihumibacter soli]
MSRVFLYFYIPIILNVKNIALLLIFLCLSGLTMAQPSNDACEQAKVIESVMNYCSADKEFTTENAAGNDVWFQFTARAFDVNISVSGNTDGTGNLGGTLQNPEVALYLDCNSAEIVTSKVSSDNVTTSYKGGLIIGNIYYVRVSGSNSGSFKLCINNYNPIFKPGQDCSSASVLCSKETFTQLDVSGGGMNSNEAAGTCLSAFGVNSEQNSAWYKWTAANNGTLTFVITPTANDDIDWVLYDLGTTDNCAAISAATAIRCDAGRGVDCFGPGQNRYTKTGLNMTSLDLSENGGCLEGQDGFVRYVDMQQGHIYALLVNNFDRGNNGFTIEFGGTGEFLGPQAAIEFQPNNICTPEQSFTFTSRASNYNRLKWTFGQGASIDTAASAGPHTVRYSTPGIKTVVLQAFGDKGCSVVASHTFTIAVKPESPPISINKSSFCLNETIILSTPAIEGATYTWTGPNNFTANGATVNIPVTSNSVAGNYTLTVTLNGCTSEPSTITVPAILQTPVITLNVTENNPCTNELSFGINYTATDYQELRVNFGQGVIVRSGTGNGPYVIAYDTPGSRTITITARSISGCSVMISRTVNVPVIPLKPPIEVNKEMFCINDTINLSTPLVTGVNYLWSGPNNFTATGASVSIPVTNTNISGQYTLVATLGQCSSEASTHIVPPIISLPVAAFTSNPKFPAKLTAPVTIQFINNSTGADSWLWDFGDGTTSTEENPQHEYATFGEYEVTLTVTKSGACSASVSLGNLVITVDNTIFVPNTFTPNADSVNDEFVITISNIQSYRIQIYNRYGTPLFETNDIFDNWKGVYNNEPLPVGTYYYIIDAVSVNGDPIKKSGSITIIK